MCEDISLKDNPPLYNLVLFFIYLKRKLLQARPRSTWECRIYELIKCVQREALDVCERSDSSLWPVVTHPRFSRESSDLENKNIVQDQH